MPGGTVEVRGRTAGGSPQRARARTLRPCFEQRHARTVHQRRPRRGAVSRGLLLGSMLCLAALGDGSAMTVASQERQPERPSALGVSPLTAGALATLQVPAVVLGAPASEASLGISISRTGAVPANSYVRIRGLSPMMSLSEGHVVAPGAWAVPVASLPDLRITIPAGASGRNEVTIALVAIDGGVVSEAKTMLVVAAAASQGADRQRLPPAAAASELPAPPAAPPQPSRGTPAAPVAPPARPSAAPPAVAALPPGGRAEPVPVPAEPPPRAPAPPPIPAADRERAEGFLARGRTLLESGNIASARLFFERAAEVGLAAGALAMGSTYDPVELSALKAVGIKPDAAEARKWYEKARDLGAGDGAQRRLERLGRR